MKCWAAWGCWQWLRLRVKRLQQNMITTTTTGQKNQTLINGASDCIKTGEACINHCLDLLAQGDKEMAACAKSVNELLAVCAALQRLATVDSKFLPKYAKVSAEVCEACEKECRKHEKKHKECKACADSCAACLKECKKIAV